MTKPSAGRGPTGARLQKDQKIGAAGYRALHQDDDHNNVKWDVTMYGPVLGAVLRF